MTKKVWLVFYEERVDEVMKRNIKKIFIVIFVTCCVYLLNISVSAKSIDCTFKVIQSNIPDFVSSIKLKDGRLLLYSSEGNAIFDPKTNKLKKTASFKSRPKINFNSILLPNGKVLFVSPNTFYPSDEFGSEIYHLIYDDLFKKELGKLRKVTSLTKEGYNNIRHEAWKAYETLSEQEKEKIYLPYIKKNPELYKRYQNYIKEYELSMYGQIFDPTTETFKYTKGKVNIRRDGFGLALLPCGKVLIIGGQIARNPEVPIGTVDKSMNTIPRQLELYSPETETFNLLHVFLPENKLPMRVFQLKNSYLYFPESSMLYNYDTNYFTKVQRLLGHEYTKLSDGQIAFVPHRSEGAIYIYDPRADKITGKGQLQIPRSSFRMVLLKDGNILVYGGFNPKRSETFKCSVYENRLEIFNAKTGKSKLLKTRHPKPLIYATLLDDGRLFFISEEGYELFTIK